MVNLKITDLKIWFRQFFSFFLGQNVWYGHCVRSFNQFILQRNRVLNEVCYSFQIQIFIFNLSFESVYFCLIALFLLWKEKFIPPLNFWCLCCLFGCKIRSRLELDHGLSILIHLDFFLGLFSCQLPTKSC